MLGYNLNFVPSPNFFDKTKFKHDTKNFCRRIKLRSYFGNSNFTASPFKSTNSSWEPKEIHHTVETFIEQFANDINQSLDMPRSGPKKNLTKEEEKALNDLMTRNDIIFCSADKGGACVILDVNDYIKEAERQLTDESFYKELPSDPTKLHNELINNVIEKFKREQLLDQKTANGLKVHDPRTPLFYLLPKIHKAGNPGRPVVSSVNCHTSKISEFIDYYLQPLVKSLPSYIQDTTDFLNKLGKLPKTLPKDVHLVTMDVKSLYTNIPNNEGIDAIKDYITKSDISNMKPVLIAFLRLVLTLNNFSFNGANYLQISGVSMGTKCAPAYANLFMGSFEDKYILPNIKNKTMLYARYIDDIFFIWTGSKKELQTFFQHLNAVHSTIKFDCKTSTESINFLDTVVQITEQREITTKLYKKPTDEQPFLHQKSYHPNFTKTSIAYSQALRIRRICNRDEDFEAEIDLLIKKLADRGYERDKIMESIEKVRKTKREETLVYKEKVQLQAIPFVATYDKRIPDVKASIDKCWETLSINNQIASKFTQKPILSFRRNKNLKDMIGQTKIKDNKVCRGISKKRGKCTPCRSQVNNKCCKHIVSTTTFKHRVTNREFDILHNVNCKSKYVVYLVECVKCNGKQYVGKTWTTVSQRIYGHRSDAKKTDSILIDRHFLEPGHNFDQHFRLTIIERIEKADMDIDSKKHLLLQREDFWIKKLETLSPNGFNEELNFPD